MDGDDSSRYQAAKIPGEWVTNVVVTEGTQKIDDRAFYCCRSLVRVSIPDSVTSIGREAFYNCENLKAIVIPEGVTTIEDETFSGCRELERIELPNSITSIGGEAFCFCEFLRTITLPKGLEEIGETAFENSGIEDFVVPNGIKVIPNWAFQRCYSLRTVEFPPSVKEIGEAAFNGCDKLENLVLPNGGLPKLTRLNLNGYVLGVEQIGTDYLISQLIVNAPNLEELSWNKEETLTAESPTLYNDDIPILLQLVSRCPSLQTLDVSYNSFTPKVFETLASLEIPGHLGRLKIFSRDESWVRSETPLQENHLLRVLEGNPRLGIWTNQFWDESEDQNVRHHLEMNRYGCRGFRVPDALWPLLIEKLAALEMDQEEEEEDASRKEIETGASNILYRLLHRHAELFLWHHAR